MLETTESMELMAQDMQREEIDTPSSRSDGSKDEPQRLIVRAESKDEDADNYEDSRALLLNTTNDSSMLDKTISLLHNLKDLMNGQGNDSEKETSILEQLEFLSEMMQEEDLSLLSTPRHSQSENRLTLFQGDDDDINNTSTAIESFRSTSVVETSLPSTRSRHDDDTKEENPWPALVEELRRRINFLEHDRSELARITQDILVMQRESAQVRLEAAVATAKRESMEQLQLFQKHTHEQMKSLYRTLCVHCQRRIYTAI
jgi:septal ring factor EnvC (AmiA/AmiB activator)